MAEVREYVDGGGRSPFGRWFNSLDSASAAKVSAAIARMESGNLADVRSLGGGLLERRIHAGPGYRIYFGREGDSLVILLGGGTKARQHQDIKDARRFWREYRRRKHEEG